MLGCWAGCFFGMCIPAKQKSTNYQHDILSITSWFAKNQYINMRTLGCGILSRMSWHANISSLDFYLFISHINSPLNFPKIQCLSPPNLVFHWTFFVLWLITVTLFQQLYVINLLPISMDPCQMLIGSGQLRNQRMLSSCPSPPHMIITLLCFILQRSWWHVLSKKKQKRVSVTFRFGSRLMQLSVLYSQRFPSGPYISGSLM